MNNAQLKQMREAMELIKQAGAMLNDLADNGNIKTLYRDNMAEASTDLSDILIFTLNPIENVVVRQIQAEMTP